MPSETVTADKTEMKKARPAKNGLNSGTSYALPEEIRTAAEGKYGTDFSTVQVHDDDVANLAAAMMNARAVAHGSDIYLGEGESVLDFELMDHELSHVAEQADASPTFAAWSIPVHNMIMTDAFLLAMATPGADGTRATTEGGLSRADKEKLARLCKGSAWNDLMESVDSYLVTGGIKLAARMGKKNNMSNESHHGVMQFIHAQGEMHKAMADIAGNMTDWGRFCYNIYLGEINPRASMSSPGIMHGYRFVAEILGTQAAHVRATGGTCAA